MPMSTKNGIFAGKLCELERQYEQTIRCLRCCQRSDHRKIQRALRCLWQEYRENDLLLQRSIAKSHSPAVAALSAGMLTKSCPFEPMPQLLSTAAMRFTFIPSLHIFSYYCT